MFKCESCESTFARRDSLARHFCRKRKTEADSETSPKKLKPDDEILCNECNISIPRRSYQGHLRSLEHKENASSFYEEGVELIRQAFKNRIANYKINLNNKYGDVKECMGAIKEKAFKLLTAALDKHESLKVNLELFGLFLLPSKDIEETKSFNTKNKIIIRSVDLEKVYQHFVDEIDNRVSTFEERESGWALKEILYLEIHINKYNPLRASSYIELPAGIKEKKAVINIQNSDEKCFMWSVLAAIHPVDKNSQRVTKYVQFEHELNFDGIDFPVKLKDISKFEKLNNISANVYGLESVNKYGKTNMEVVGPLHFTEDRKTQHVNLLVIDDGNGNSHYCCIRNLNKLVGSQLSKHKARKFLCDGCLIYFSSNDKLSEHQERDCGHIRVNLPSTNPKVDKLGIERPGNILKFENFEKMMKVPFVIYADFECALQPIYGCEPCNDKSFTQETHQHVPYSFGYYIKCSYDDSLSKFETYRGSDCTQIFYQRLEADVKRIYNDHLKHVLTMHPLTDDQKSAHGLAPNCCICQKPFIEGCERIQDHDHLSGLYRGPAHGGCNLNFRLPKFIPVFFHNLSNYDAHLFIRSLGDNTEKIDVIAENKEKYISFSKHVLVDKIVNGKGFEEKVFMKIRFLDSFRFMPSSLNSLAANLKDDQCVEVIKHFPEETKFNLMRQKGVFPYSYVDSFERLNDLELPSRIQCYNNLTKEEISPSDYARAKTVWDTFNCESLGEYSDVYLKSDVLLLTDIFETFRKVCFDAYNLDPCQFFTAPSLSWAAMLKYTNVELELLTDIDMLHFIKKGIRGGIAQCSKRKAVANNKYIPHYDPSKPTSFINYLDATNLYGAAMSQPLPYGGFEWLSSDEIEDLNIVGMSDDSTEGYILEVDLEYPKELHDLHNDLPFCAENIIPPESKLPKLIPNLNNKSRYVIHYNNLKQCLNAGLKLIKIHRVLKFRQSLWLKEYIDLNTQRRNRAENKFEKDFYKLMNNSVYGKTMENVEKRADIKLVSHWKNKGRKVGAQNLIAKPNFKSCSIFTETLVAVQMEKLKVTYDKPIYAGFCVLELSKLIIYEFFYNFIKTRYGDCVQLLYTDTDSLILQTFTDDFYIDIKNNLEKFDTSNFPNNNQFGIPKSISIIGKMKDEYAGKVIWEFCGTGAKAYSTNVEGEFTVDGKTTKRAKGVNASVVRDELEMEDYKNVVDNQEIVYKKMPVFRSRNHVMYTELKNKVALSSADDKRYIVSNGEGETLAWGHYRLENTS